MSVSDEQAEQELYHTVCTHPTLEPMRVIVRRLLADGSLTGDDSDAIEAALVDFLRSDAAFESAVKIASAPKIRLVPTELPNVLTYEVVGLPEQYRVVPPESVPTVQQSIDRFERAAGLPPGMLGMSEGNTSTVDPEVTSAALRGRFEEAQRR